MLIDYAAFVYINANSNILRVSLCSALRGARCLCDWHLSTLESIQLAGVSAAAPSLSPTSSGFVVGNRSTRLTCAEFLSAEEETSNHSANSTSASSDDTMRM